MSLTRRIIAGLTAISTLLTASPVLGVTAEELLAQIQQLQQQLNQLIQQYQQLTGQQPSLGVPAACQGITFDRDLKVGMSGADVKCLQALLNQDPETKVAETGPGSPGNETSYFGPKTKAAVIKFQEKYKDEVLTPLGLTAGTGFVGPKTRAKLNAILQAGGVTPPTPPSAPAAGLTVKLATDTPAAGVILGNQVRAPLMKIEFTNGDATEGKVTELKLKRIGIGHDGLLNAIYLLDENGNRVGDETVFVNGVASFKNSAGVFAVPAGQTKSILVVGDVASTNVTGYTLGVSLTDVKGTFTALNATLPLNGNLMSIGNPVTTKVEVDSNSSSTQTVSIQAGKTDQVVWQGTINPTAKVKLSAIAFRGIGNIDPAHIKNYRLYIAGSQVGSAVEMSSGYVVKFNLADNPIELTAGSKELKVLADIVGGSGRRVYFEIYEKEAVAVDVEYGVGVPVTVPDNRDWKTIDISGASATLTLAPDSPVSVPTSSDVLVAKYTLKVYGERVKFTQFVVTSSNATLTSVVIYVNGAAHNSATNVGTSATNINAVPVFYVEAGETATIEVKADTTNYATSAIVLDLAIKGESATVANVSVAAPRVRVDVRPASFNVTFTDEPSSFLALAGQKGVTVAKYKLEAKSADATVKEITVQVASPNNIYGVAVNLGGTDYTAEFDGTDYVVKNLNYTVPAGSAQYALVKVDLMAVNAGTDGGNVRVSTFKVKYYQAGKENETPNVPATNNVLVYNALPKVEAKTTGSKADLIKDVPTTVTLYEWTVSAKGGTVKVATTTLKWVKAGATATTTVSNIKVLVNGIDKTSSVSLASTSLTNASATSGALVIYNATSVFSVEKDSTITITVKADVTAAAGGYIRVWLAGDATSTDANFVWDDDIKSNINGLYVEGLPAEGTEYYQHTIQQ